jgi:hypothetical protein
MRLLALLLVAVFASESFGNFLLVARLTRNDNAKFASGGGEFALQLARRQVNSSGATVSTVYASNANANWAFSTDSGLNLASTINNSGFYQYKTFCVENSSDPTEQVNTGTEYYVGGKFFDQQTGKFLGFAALTENAFFGGPLGSNGSQVSGSGRFDPLDSKTINLFEEYSAGSGPGQFLDPTTNTTVAKTNTLAREVQDAIWSNEGENTTGNTSAARIASLLNSVGLGGEQTRVLSLFNTGSMTGAVVTDLLNFKAGEPSTYGGLGGRKAQDQLFFTGGLRNTQVPEPATFALFGMGALAAGFYRARRGSKKA